MSPLIRQVTQEYCQAKGITKHADWLEKEVRIFRDNKCQSVPIKPNRRVTEVFELYKKRL